MRISNKKVIDRMAEYIMHKMDIETIRKYYNEFRGKHIDYNIYISMVA